MKQRFSKRTRLVSALLTLAMVFTFLPFSAFAATDSYGPVYITDANVPDKTFREYLLKQFDKDGNSVWKQIEDEWLDLYRNKTVKDGISAMQVVTGDDEWLCEAYMKTDYTKLCEADFQKTLNNYLAYLVKEGKVYES